MTPRSEHSSGVDDLLTSVEALAREVEQVASDASYRGTERQVNGLLGVATDVRALAAKISGLRSR